MHTLAATYSILIQWNLEQFSNFTIICNLKVIYHYSTCPKKQDTGIRRAEVVGKHGLVWSTTFYIEITDSVHGNGKGTKRCFSRELVAFRSLLFVSPLANEPINIRRFEAACDWRARDWITGKASRKASVAMFR